MINPEDASWFMPGAYLAAIMLADVLSNSSYWDIIGLELKSEMTYAV